MADVNANIDINIDSSNALAQLKSLQRQISQFHTSISKSSEAAALAQKGLQKNLLNSINAIGAFSAEMRTVKTSAESFTDSLEKNKFSMREYFRYAGASTKTFGKLFKSEFDTIGKVAEERVKRLQTQYIKMGRDTNGAMRAIAVMPTQLNMEDYTTKVQIAAQKQALFNQLMKQGSTNLLNFGKNTQWAGRQLMVGFTLPLMALGTTATRTFMEMEAQALKFRKVYGDLFTPKEETQQALADVTELGKMFTKYGIAVKDTVGLAADAAAAGFQGIDLQRQTAAATKLSVLGQIDNQKALETTISLQNAFGKSSDELASSIDFLNAVENQTVVSLDDITTAIPKVAPVIQQLGGDVKDLAFFLTAMKEGGVNASEGANALKSGLAALINPTTKASQMLASMGINIKGIVEKNKGDLKATVIGFAQALDTLAPLERARAIEQMFGKFQFARLSTLFQNVTRDGTQASRVLKLAGTSVEDLAALSEQELGMTADSAMNKFKKTVEDLKVSLVPVGQAFLEAVTPILEFVGNILEKFSNLSSGTKKFITLLTVGIGAVGPVLLMTFGLLANGVANIIKLFLTLRGGYQRLTGETQLLGAQTQYMTSEQLDAAAAAHSLDQTHAKLTQTFTAEASAVNQLIQAYNSAAGAARNFTINNPGMMLPGRGPKKLASGIVSVPGPKGAGDIVPAMLSPGEAVIPSDMAKKYAPLIQGMVAGNIPGFMAGNINVGGSIQQLDFSRSSTAKSVQNLINEMVKDGSGIENSLTIVNETLARMAKDTKITIDGFVRELSVVTKEFTGQLIPTDVLINAGRGKTKEDVRKYSSPVGMSIPKQVEQYGDTRFIVEVERAQQSANAAQEAIRQYFTNTGVDLEGVTKASDSARKIVAQSADVHRAHIIELRDQIDKQFNEAWDPKAWIAQASSLNQLSNILQSSPNTMDEYLRHLNEVNADEQIVASIRSKLTKNIALQESELQVQKQVLERMLADQQTRSKVSPGFIPQAVGSIAATNYLAQYPQTLIEGVGSRSAAEASRQQQALTSARFRGQQSFTPITQEAKALTDQIVLETARAAGVQSPSKRTIPIGEDIARGLEVGMQNRKDDVALVSSQLATNAVQTMQGGVRNVPFRSAGQPGFVSSNAPAGITLSEVTEKTRRNKEQLYENEKLKRSKLMDARMDSLNKALMGGTFAITALASAGSMAGGTLGDVSAQISKYSGILFGLMSITQLLTQAKIAELAATRLAIAKQASAFASYGGGLAGKSGILGSLARVGIGITKFLGPIGLATTALMIGYGAYKLINNRLEENRQKLEAFGDAVSTTKEQFKSLGDYFGVVPTKTGLENTTQEKLVSNADREAINKFKASDTFKKDFAGDAKAVSRLSAEDARLALQTKGAELLGKGFTKDQVNIIITAIQEEAGKSDLDINFKSIKLDKLDADIRAGLESKLAALPKFISDTMTTEMQVGEDGRWYKAIIMGPEAKAEIENQGKALKTYFNSLSGMIQNGAISFDKFNQSFDTMSTLIKTNIPDSATQMALLNAALEQMDARLAKGAIGIQSFESKLLLAKAAAIGLNLEVTNAMVNALMMASLPGATAEDMIRADAVASDIEKMIKIRDKAMRMVNKGTGGGGGSGELNALQQRIKAIKDQTNAYIILRNAKVDEATATELSNDAQIASLVLANSKGKSLQQLIALINEYKNALKAQTDAELTYMEKPNLFKKQLEQYQAQANLRDKMIDIQFASKIKAENDALKVQEQSLQNVNDQIQKITDSQIKPIQAVIATNNFALEQISLQEDVINEKYNKQIEALDKIATINQDIANIQKQRLSIADALTRGDISAAAQLAQEARAQQAQSSVTGAKDALTATRDAQISALGRNAIEKQNKDLQLQISTIERNQLLILQTQKDTIEASIDATNRNIKALDLQVETLKNGAYYAGKTKQEIDDLDSLIKAADAAGVKFDEVLLSQSNNAVSLAKALGDAVTNQKALASLSGLTSTAKANTTSSEPLYRYNRDLTPEEKAQIAAQGGTINRIPMNYGGVVRRMAIGGYVAGSGMTDKVPALLTPGEFVMNKRSAQQFGPLLSMLNESKYPSMLGGRTGVQVPVNNISTSMNDNSTAVYNYSLGFNINGTNSNANDIARAVMREIKNVDSQRVRGQRI